MLYIPFAVCQILYSVGCSDQKSRKWITRQTATYAAKQRQLKTMYLHRTKSHANTLTR